jgi:predicted nucleotidyltransferase
MEKYRAMDKYIIIEKLLEHEAELKAAGIVRLSIFGSVARGDATAQSDVDLMGDFDRAQDLTVFDMAGLEVRLADILGILVDLADRRIFAISGRNFRRIRYGVPRFPRCFSLRIVPMYFRLAPLGLFAGRWEGPMRIPHSANACRLLLGRVSVTVPADASFLFAGRR